MSYLFCFRKYYCPSHSFFQYIYPKGANDKMSVVCLICHNKYDEISLKFMTTHRNACKVAPAVANQQNIVDNVGSEESRFHPQIANVGKPQNKKNDNRRQVWPSNRPEHLINLDCLQFDRKRGNIPNKNQTIDVAQCRLCKRNFLIDRIKLLTHR